MYPAYIHTQTTARNIDQAAIKTYQIPSLILMEHAAIKSAEIIKKSSNQLNPSVYFVVQEIMVRMD